MAYNPTATWVSSIRIVANGEPGTADIFNRPTEDLDSRTLHLKSQHDALAGTVSTLQGSHGALATDFSDLVDDFDALQLSVGSLVTSLSGMSAETLNFAGSASLAAGTIAQALEQAALLGGGGGGGAGSVLVIRYGETAASGTEVTHNLGNIDHMVAVSIASTAGITPELAASVGEAYVIKGANSDMVYFTGGTTGVLFDYVASPNPGAGSIITLSGTFSGLTGTPVTHNLGNSNHRVTVQISSFDVLGAAAVTSVGAIYVLRGANADTVYNTGSSDPIPFDVIIA